MAAPKQNTHGEGDYEATRRFRKRSEKFIAEHDTQKIARAAAPHTKAEARELQDAEAIGRSRAKTRPETSARPPRKRR